MIENILKIADINSRNISEDTLSFIRGNQTYSDNHLEEHIYNTEWLMELADEKHVQQHILDEINNIHLALSDSDCSYFRVITE